MTELEAKIIEWIETGAAAVGDKLPQVAQEIATYGMVSNFCWAFFSAIILGFCIFVFLDFLKDERIMEDEVSLLLPGIGAFVSLVSLVASVNEFFKAWLCPTLYIIEVLK